LRILFGPEHDGLHVDPARSGAYEWWYFDALSDDGRYALVVIYFLGSPMTPYYKAVVDGKNPDPRDWCGVFVSLHERKRPNLYPYRQPWREIAYAYNLYRSGSFADAPNLQVGQSILEFDPKGVWSLDVRERGLWFGETRVEARFTIHGQSLPSAPLADKSDSHTWVCVAPVCRIEATVALSTRRTIRFVGNGYHDHNFGTLPWEDVDIWYWGRVPMRKGRIQLDAVWLPGEEAAREFNERRREEEYGKPLGTMVYYNVVKDNTCRRFLLFTPESEECKTESFEDIVEVSINAEERQRFGLFHGKVPKFLLNESPGNLVFFESWDNLGFKPFSEGPFYRRLPVISAWINGQNEKVPEAYGEGIAEVFRPARLCGPIASRAMWTRIRRRG
jgi:hypothetical protein